MKAAIAAALVNFLWEGAAIGVLAWLGFSLARTPRVRYVVGIAALALMAIAPVVTGVAASRLAVVPGPSSLVPGSRPSQVPGATSERLGSGRGTEDVSGPGTRDRGPGTLPALPQLDPRLAAMVLAVWLLGVAALSTRLAVGWLGARRLTRRVSEAGASVQAIANRLVVSLRIRATIRVVESALVHVPSVVGAFKPVVLLPTAAMSGLSMEQVEALLAHELAHVRRHDYLVNLLQSAIETLLFYHPAVWLVSRRVRQERELCCDDLALEVCSDRVAYASALADLESQRAIPSPALAATGGSLLARVRRILRHDEVSPLAGRSQSLAGVAILASIILLAGGQAARAKAEDARRAEWSSTPPQASEISGRAAWSPTPPQAAQGIAGGVAGGVSGGVQGGVPGGIKGGVPESVPILISATDDPTLRIVEDTDITVRVKTNGKAAKPFTDSPLRVGKDGFVMLPLLGRYSVAGKTLREAATSIRSDLIFRKFFADPEVDVRANMEIFPAVPIPVEAPRGADTVRPVEIAPVRAPAVPPARVVILGEVKLPGVIPWREGLTVEQVVSTAGVTPFADTARIQLKGTPPNPDAALKLSDVLPPDAVVMVPLLPAFSVTVQGAVRMPGEITLRANRNTVYDALAQAGGLTPGAGARIFVRNGARPVELTLSTEAIQNRATNVNIQDGDAIIVEAAQTFSVTGFVKKPGSYTWEPGMTLEKALAAAGGITPEGAPNRISIKRKDPATGEEVVLKNVKSDATILAGDVITVPPRYFFP